MSNYEEDSGGSSGGNAKMVVVKTSEVMGQCLATICCQKFKIQMVETVCARTLSVLLFM